MKKLFLFLLLSALFACNKDTPIVRYPVAPTQDTPKALPSAYKLRYQIFDSGGSHTDHHSGYSSWSKPVDVWDSLTVDTTSQNPASRYLLISVDTFRFIDSSLIISANKLSGKGWAARNKIASSIPPPVIYVVNDSFTINYPTYIGIGGTIDALIIKGVIYH